MQVGSYEKANGKKGLKFRCAWDRRDLTNVGPTPNSLSPAKRGKRPLGRLRHGTTMVDGKRMALMGFGVFGFTSPTAKFYQVNHAFTKNTLIPHIYVGNRFMHLIIPIFIIFCRMIYTPLYSAECFMQLTVICLTLVFLHLIASNFFCGFKECI